MGSFLVVRSKIKEFAESFNVAGDVGDILEEKAIALIKEGCKRAKANGRRTLMGKDI